MPAAPPLFMHAAVHQVIFHSPSLDTSAAVCCYYRSLLSRPLPSFVFLPLHSVPILCYPVFPLLSFLSHHVPSVPSLSFISFHIPHSTFPCIFVSSHASCSIFPSFFSVTSFFTLRPSRFPSIPCVSVLCLSVSCILSPPSLFSHLSCFPVTFHCLPCLPFFLYIPSALPLP